MSTLRFLPSGNRCQAANALKDIPVHPTKFFRPSDRKLCRRRSRPRLSAPTIAVTVMLALTVAFRHARWN